jgi:hypothetical protein
MPLNEKRTESLSWSGIFKEYLVPSDVNRTDWRKVNIYIVPHIYFAGHDSVSECHARVVYSYAMNIRNHRRRHVFRF